MERTKINEEAIGAPGTVKIGPTTYLAAQMTKGDFITLLKHLRTSYRARVVSPMQAVAKHLDNLPEKYRDQAIKHAVDAQGRAKGETAEPELSELIPLMYEPEGAAVLAWISVRKNHPDVKLEDLACFIDADNVDELLAKLFLATGMDGLEKNSGGATGS